MAKRKTDDAGAGAADAVLGALSSEDADAVQAAVDAGAGDGVLIDQSIIPIPSVQVDTLPGVAEQPPAEITYGSTFGAFCLPERAIWFYGGKHTTSDPEEIAALDAYIARGFDNLWREA